MKHVNIYSFDEIDSIPVIDEIEKDIQSHAMKYEIAIIPSGPCTYFLSNSERIEGIIKKNGGVLLGYNDLIRLAIMQYEDLFPVKYGCETLRRLLDIQPSIND